MKSLSRERLTYAAAVLNHFLDLALSQAQARRLTHATSGQLINLCCDADAAVTGCACAYSSTHQSGSISMRRVVAREAVAALVAVSASARSWLGPGPRFKCVIDADDPKASTLVGDVRSYLLEADIDPTVASLLLEAFESQVSKGIKCCRLVRA